MILDNVSACTSGLDGCDQMLLLDNSTTPLMPAGAMLQRRFFVTQTLHAKCRDDIHQLPVEAPPSLRDSLVLHLLRYSANRGQLSPALMTRLALAVSALAVHMCWSTVVPDGSKWDALQNQQQANRDRVVELVLKCSAIPNREVALMTLNFWFRFVHELEIYSGNNLR